MSEPLPLTDPGVYAGIPLDTYHSPDLFKPGEVSVSHSEITRLWDGAPSDFYAHWPWNPNRLPHEETAYFRLGSAAHHLLLGEDDFRNQYIERPAKLRDSETGKLMDWHGNRKDCKAWLAEQHAAGKIVVTHQELETIRDMAASLARHALVKHGILKGEVERTMVARDPESGFWLRARPDVIPLGGDYCDLKTIAEGSQVAAIGAIGNYGYHMQAGLVWEIAELLGMPFQSFTLLFVGKEPPNNVVRCTLADEMIALGRRQNRAMLRQIANCYATGDWHGPEDIEAAKLGPERIARIEQRLAYLEAAARPGRAA
jgi:PDDEXK-like uncharacterized protein DUF3799